MKTIVLTGGGTGGHVIPNLSLLPLLQKHFDKIYYLGTNKIEKELTKGKVEFYEISAHKFDRSKILKNLFLPYNIIKDTFFCKKILKKLKPDIIFSKGGYVSLPVCLAGKMLKIKIVSHESDLTLGLSNKIIYKLSDKFLTTFMETSKNLKKAVYTGSPIREKLKQGNTNIGFQITKLDKTKKIILFTGGSSGAEAINEFVYKNLKILNKKYNVILLCGKGKKKNIENTTSFCCMEFCFDIEHLFKISSFIVTRSGSNAIYELLYLKKKMILVPLPKGNSRGDQVENARYFEKKGYAKVINQEDLTIENLENAIKESENFVLPTFDLNGAQKIVEEILSTIKKV